VNPGFATDSYSNWTVRTFLEQNECSFLRMEFRNSLCCFSAHEHNTRRRMAWTDTNLIMSTCPFLAARWRHVVRSLSRLSSCGLASTSDCTEGESNSSSTTCAHKLNHWLIGVNGTFSTNGLYRAFEKYVAVKKVKLMKVKNVTFGNTENKPLQ